MSGVGDRMKLYESATRYVLTPRTWTLIRVDGRAFHTLLRGSDKPFDLDFMSQMDRVAKELCEQVTTCRFAYVQSDEVSLLLAPFGSEQTEPWFGGIVQKMASVSASIATMAFNREGRYGDAMFDSRVFTVPTSMEAENYFIWRQADATRNSLSMLARAYFSHKRLHGMNGSQMQEMLWSEHGVNWNDLDPHSKRGRICTRFTWTGDIEFVNKRTNEVEVAENVTRHTWAVSEAPVFTAGARAVLRNLVNGPDQEA